MIYFPQSGLLNIKYHTYVWHHSSWVSAIWFAQCVLVHCWWTGRWFITRDFMKRILQCGRQRSLTFQELNAFEFETLFISTIEAFNQEKDRYIDDPNKLVISPILVFPWLFFFSFLWVKGGTLLLLLFFCLSR